LLLPFEAADFAAAAAAADRAWEWSGGVDVLVNNAGISQRSLAIDTDFTVYQRMIEVDLLGPIALTQALLQRMAARGGGQLVMMSSLAGKVGSPLRSAYSAAKHGLIGYADALRVELNQAGIGVFVVTPGSGRLPSRLTPWSNGLPTNAVPPSLCSKNSSLRSMRAMQRALA
jgi:NAD(P)-dependent dehydrogenase (short-subunit alcohol dehydrogenase family)